MKRRELTGEEVEKLAAQLTSRLDEFELETITYGVTGDRLHDAYVSGNLPLGRQIYQLLIELEKLGVTGHFVREVYHRSPMRGDLRDSWRALYPDIEAAPEEGGAELALQTGGRAVEEAPPLARAPGLEKNIRPNLPMLDVRVWLSALSEVERKVCRVERRDGAALGTGFLVGPGAVLTNWHVVKNMHAAGGIGDCVCRFDYLRLDGDGRQPGVAVAVDALASHRPYSDGEGSGNPDDPPPTKEELDYALLTIKEAAGEDRGWVALPHNGEMPVAEAPLMIVQHPDGGPMKLALDTRAVIGPMHDGLRLRYATNTEPGSSGSPGFGIDWKPVVLHHMGDPAWRATYNQGVPLGLIRAAIDADSKIGLLGD